MRAAVAGLTLCGSDSVRDTVAVETRASRATSASFAVLVDEVRFMQARHAGPAGRYRQRSQITSTSTPVRKHTRP